MQTKIQRKERNLIEKFIITLPDFHWVNRAVFLNVLVRAATKKVPSIPFPQSPSIIESRFGDAIFLKVEMHKHFQTQLQPLAICDSFLSTCRVMSYELAELCIIQTKSE